MNWTAGPVSGTLYQWGAIVVQASTTTGSTAGGRLSLKNSATITGDFSTTPYAYSRELFPGWLGIFVEGVPSHGQNLKNGQASLKNSTIQNATFAVSNFNYQDEPSLNYSTGFTNAAYSNGGVITANGMTFENNVTSVNMINYNSGSTGYINDQSSFINCHFDASSTNLNSAWSNFTAVNTNFSNSFQHVYLQNVHGVKFYGCAFTLGSSVNNYFYAINATNSGFSVDNYCSAYSIFNACTGTTTASSVSGRYVYSGISAHNSGNYNPVVVQNTGFSGINFPVNLIGCNSPVIRYNNISLSLTSPVTFPDYNVAIGLSGCTGYTLQYNTIIGSSPNHSYPLSGISITNSGANYNVASSNTCYTLDYGIQAIGSNRSYSLFSKLQTGLTFYCNDMSTNSQTSANDLSVMLPDGVTTSVHTSGIAPVQGNISNAAGNSFSTSTTENLYNNTSNSFNYYYTTTGTQNPTRISTGISKTLSSSQRTCAGGLGTKTFDLWANTHTYLVPIIVGGGGAWTSSTSLMEAAVGNNDSVINGFLYLDSASSDFSGLESVLDSLTYLYDYQVQLAGLYVQENRYPEAFALLNSLPSADSLDSTTTVNINNLVEAYTVSYALYKNGYDWSSLTSTQQDSIAYIDTTDLSYAQIATHQLLHQYTGAFYPPLLAPIALGAKHAAFVNNVVNPTITLYPNPVTDMLNINVGDETGLTMVLSDISGRQLTGQALNASVNTINMHELSAGVYFVKIYKNALLLKVDKVVKN
ncbi:MAG: T9SS type A sorting domain-containing protein [Flavipsychrobacter sp.]|nr:T9SS type A sorting domain-containing protein [Flavipsychrobacter sp.]